MDDRELNSLCDNQKCAMLELDKDNIWNDHDCGDLTFGFIELHYSNFIGRNPRNEGIAYTFEEAETYYDANYSTKLANKSIFTKMVRCTHGNNDN